MVLSGEQRGRDVLLTCVCLKRPSQLAASFLLTVFTDDAAPLSAAMVSRSNAELFHRARRQRLGAFT